ncbi:alpha/beta hydrolase [Stenomitos frigidus]|uniref:alpha/beta hydrolase n=1 Tax=Stenomitos frigidus TaxID=1886765 RepID=UPI001C62A481|nr:alpha/beta fold hydrolase [Stenomitos frigidus]
MGSLSIKAIIGSLLAVVVAYGSACTFLFLRQNHFIFFPSKTIAATPSDLNLPYEEVWLPVPSSGQNGTPEQLHGWWIPANGTQQNVVLHLHGNGSNISGNLSQALRFHQAGFAVLMVDYRGYGRSQGAFPTEASVYEDAKAAWDYLVQQRVIASERLVLFGHSLGGAIAIDLAIDHPEAGGLIVQSSFTSMQSMVNPARFWMLPIDWLLTQRFDSLTKVRSLRMPLLYIHGTADAKVPSSMSEALFAASPQPKQLLLVAGATHNDVAEFGGAEYLQTLKQFSQQIDRKPQKPMRP